MIKDFVLKKIKQTDIRFALILSSLPIEDRAYIRRIPALMTPRGRIYKVNPIR